MTLNSETTHSKGSRGRPRTMSHASHSASQGDTIMTGESSAAHLRDNLVEVERRDQLAFYIDGRK